MNASSPVVTAMGVPSVLQPVGCTLDAAFTATKTVDCQVAAAFARQAVHHGRLGGAQHVGVSAVVHVLLILSGLGHANARATRGATRDSDGSRPNAGRPPGEPEPTGYWLSTRPADVRLRDLLRLDNIGRRIEHDYRDRGAWTVEDQTDPGR